MRLKQKFFSFCAIVSLTLTTASFAHAANDLNATFCVSWPLTYVDNAVGAPTSEIVPNVVWEVHRKDEPNYLYDGILNAEGCTNSLALDRSQIYEFRIVFQILGKGSRHVAILPTTATGWETRDDDVEGFAQEIDFTPLIGTPVTTLTWYIHAPDIAVARAIPVANDVLQKADELDWPSDYNLVFGFGSRKLCLGASDRARLAVQVDNKNIGNDGSCFGYNCHICLATGVDEKFVIAHEIGHAIGKMNGNGTIGASNGDKTDMARYRNHDYCRSGKTHNLHSREFEGMASAEAFAHFIATATYNDRLPTADFKFYKNTYDLWTPAGSSPASAKDPIITVNQTDPLSGQEFTWVDKMCKPPVNFPFLSAEGDWLNFFWGIYSASSDNFTIDEINRIWERAPKTVYTPPGSSKTKINPVWCVPRSAPSQGWENGWMCKEYAWEWTDPSWKSNSGTPQTKEVAELSKIGYKFNNAQSTMTQMFSQDAVKVRVFVNAALNAKIAYDY